MLAPALNHPGGLDTGEREELLCLLQFPGWTYDLSPFSHTPQLPANDLAIAPLLVLTLIAAALGTVGLAGLRRRDVAGP
ncbi:MAG: hypothetical protein GEU83_01520 [Pseudonocardiaceae bacterium]|nr:hypothetical protein [Pseudonocardiaceae bacterium]